MIRILFVCLGNICRSPAAHAVMEKMIIEAGLEKRIEVDSAGTMGYHSGEPCDSRMDATLRRRGYEPTHRARRLTKADFDSFDYIFAMDRTNLRDILAVRPSNDSRARVELFLGGGDSSNCDEVPDPYYGGQKGFDKVIDLAEMGCASLLKRLALEHSFAQ
jgi:protein-tyrosine phosphatase